MTDPAVIQFMAVESRKGCKGCLFEEERSSVCHEACRQAKLRQLPDCDERGPGGKFIIYVPVEVDPRQQDLFDQEQP